ncbi:MAG: alpha-L-rhamnosidase [Gammaproteobacteria bacterium]|nr:MAG: alpha-L-rhamnosidase [Gammaproteobacteria bacterium]
MLFKNSIVRKITLVIVPALMLWTGSSQANAQEATKASWISHPDITGSEFGVYHFRKDMHLSAKPDAFNVHVSADNRYRLYVNGVSVVAGPQRSDVMHWRYETIDLAPYLTAGKNVIAAVVWNWGEHKPIAQHTHKTGFLMRGATQREERINTGTTLWKVTQNKAYSVRRTSRKEVGGYYASPHGEVVDASKYTWGWNKLSYDASTWPDAVGAGPVRARGSFRHSGGWQLVPRTIPFMDEHETRFASVRRTSGVNTNGAFLKNNGALDVPANTKASLLLDQSYLTNAYFQMRTSKGKGAKITVTYAEAMKDAKGNKGHRDEIEGKTVQGLKDIFKIGGGDNRAYQTLWFRTYRYVSLDIETAGEALELHDVKGLYTGYPYKVTARFDGGPAWLKDMWDINVRVAQICAWETYFDTPYYEQLQYIGDTRLQALIQLYMTGDDRLMRQAITHFDLSRIPEGLTGSRYPSDIGQYIPTFSLFWVAMVHDYHMLRDDPAYVKDRMTGVRGVLDWFEDKVDDTGLVGPLPWWPFVDWPDEFKTGMAPGSRDGHSILVSLHYVYAMQRAIELEKAFGREHEAKRLQGKVDDMLDAIRIEGWVAEKGMFKDALEGETYSQHTNTLAILTGAASGADKAALMEKILSDKTLTQAGYYFGFYVLEALHEAGLGDRYIEQLKPWQDMLAIGLTSTPEKPGKSRTDSHAWGAHPNYGLLATVLGIRPAEAGFKSVMIEPKLGELKNVSGVLPHPGGNIAVKLDHDGKGNIDVQVTLPKGISGFFNWQGAMRKLKSGTQSFRVKDK